MIGILLVTHGTLAEGLKDAAQLIIGERENFSTIGLFTEDSVDALPVRVRQAVSAFENVDGVLILADLFGASPFNAAARAAYKLESTPVNVVTGVNLGMLLEVLMQRESKNVKELSKLAVKSGQQSIVSLAEKMAEE